MYRDFIMNRELTTSKSANENEKEQFCDLAIGQLDDDPQNDSKLDGPDDESEKFEEKITNSQIG